MARSVTLDAGAGIGIGGGGAPSPAPSGQGRRTATRGKLRLSLRLGGLHGDTFYLWTLLALELAATWALRRWSRGHHGG